MKPKDKVKQIRRDLQILQGYLVTPTLINPDGNLIIKGGNK